jgi:hypothetical protein
VRAQVGRGAASESGVDKALALMFGDVRGWAVNVQARRIFWAEVSGMTRGRRSHRHSFRTTAAICCLTDSHTCESDH